MYLVLNESLFLESRCVIYVFLSESSSDGPSTEVIGLPTRPHNYIAKLFNCVLRNRCINVYNLHQFNI